MITSEIEHRFKFHPADTQEKRDAHQAIREACMEAALRLNEIVPDCREKSLAITRLEEAMMHANAAIARNT